MSAIPEKSKGEHASPQWNFSGLVFFHRYHLQYAPLTNRRERDPFFLSVKLTFYRIHGL